MRKFGKLIPLLLLLIVGGCAPAWTTEGKIVAPAYEQCPLEGKWTVSGQPDADGLSTADSQAEESRFFQFSRETAIFGSNVWSTPTYKIKKVDARDYLMTRYTVLDSYLATIDKSVEVVTVFADANYLGEFMKTDEDDAIAFIQNQVLLLHKVAARADDPASIANASSGDINHYNKTGASGVFMGLKIPSQNDYVYQTLWIAADNKKLRPVLSRNDIFFPRKSGFWQLQVKNVQNREGDGKELSARNVAEKEPTPPREKVPAASDYPAAKSIVINYIGNDYAAIEKNTNGIVRLQVLPVDNLSSPIGIKVADLLGPAGLKSYQGGREQAIQILAEQENNFVNADVNQDNFGLTRRNGHWQLQGRVNYNADSTPAAVDYNINFLPPANLVFYDTLYPGWQSIKDRVPNALDAVTSPNKDFAVVKTKSKLYIFSINGEQLNSSPLGEIPLPEGTTIIMAEWATGFYVDDWEKNFSANGAVEIGK
jgi:hypothetical protein